MLRKKKQLPLPEIEGRTCGSSALVKADMPLLGLIRTLSMRGVQKYEQFSMSSALIDATIEREVQRGLAGRNDWSGPMKIIAIGIAVFIIMVGATVLLQMTPQIASNAPTVPGIVQGIMLLLWRKKEAR